MSGRRTVLLIVVALLLALIGGLAVAALGGGAYWALPAVLLAAALVLVLWQLWRDRARAFEDAVQRWAELLDAMPEGVLLAGGPDGRLLEANPAFLKLLG